ncbi:hypothetical protein CspHIS471_0507990 [Cutaneotrichosporon sp. HIS471]|nr:hypothetical protein CspHIS471_0507990 [Cutaneotrichosporon sp. HIS471]
MINMMLALTLGLLVLAICMEYQILTLLLSVPHVYPPLPNNPIVRPPAYVITLIVLLVIHPLVCVAGWALKGYREREVRIALQEEAEAANARARRAEARSPPPPPVGAETTEAAAPAEARDASPPPKAKKKAATNPEEEPLLET